MVSQYTKFEVSRITRYDMVVQNAENGVVRVKVMGNATIW